MKPVVPNTGFKGYAIVTDGLWRKSLSVVRSLGRAGYHVCVMGASRLTTGFWSRYTNFKYTGPTASIDAEGFGKSLRHLLSLYKGVKPVVFPMEDDTIIWCSAHRDLLSERAHLLLPPHSSLMAAENKNETFKLALSLGLDCPETYFVNTAPEDESAAYSALGAYVVKPARGSGSSGLIYGDGSYSFNSRAYFEKYGPFMVQERIDPSGQGLGVSVVMDRSGQLAAHFTHARLYEYPNSGGPSTQRTGIRDDRLLEASLRLLKAMHWSGVAMVEWKADPKRGRPVLMEINPRFWGSLELAVRSGVNFPLIYADLASGLEPPYFKGYQPGLVCRWLFPGDILRYLTSESREPLKVFLKSCLTTSEEWNFEDKRGFAASFICQALLGLKPSYWKYLRRSRPAPKRKKIRLPANGSPVL